MEDRSGNQGNLLATATALKKFRPAAPELHGTGCAALWADKALGPAQFLKGYLTLDFCAIAFQKIRQTQPRLKLNAIHGHGRFPPMVLFFPCPKFTPTL
jgi:hypothetical protein